MPFLLLSFPLKNLLWFWWVYLYVLFFFSYSLRYSFSILCVCCFNDNMLWGCSVFMKSVWCPVAVLHLNGQNFLKIWEIFCYYFIEYIMNAFCLDLFSFLNAHDSQVYSLDRVGEFFLSFFKLSFIYSHVHTWFGSFLPCPPSPFSPPLPPLLPGRTCSALISNKHNKVDKTFLLVELRVAIQKDS
jgi:hypothetical protein